MSEEKEDNIVGVHKVVAEDAETECKGVKPFCPAGTQCVCEKGEWVCKGMA